MLFMNNNFTQNLWRIFLQTSISKPGDAESIGLAVVNTIIGGSAGGLTVLFYNKWILGQKWSYLMSLNGALTGTDKLSQNNILDQTWLEIYSCSPLPELQSQMYFYHKTLGEL